jgi:hypothetical protein
MSCRKLAAAWTVVLSALMMPSIHAQDDGPDPLGSGPTLIPAQVAPHSAQPLTYDGIQQSAASRQGFDPANCRPPMAIDANLGSGAGNASGGGGMQQQGYVRLGAPLYPSPRPNIPIWTGSTMITNQAFAPHEMLYPHTYRAMYPPFYHRVKGGWILTPLGVRSHEKWELQGTMVQVKYRSTYPSMLSGAGWHPPATSYMHGAWR